MTRRALCVGINAYPNAPLSGCVNDAIDWADVLTQHGYQTELLLDQTATKVAIIQKLGSLIAAARFGDRIVFSYSGHGTWLPDRSGDEPDARDEALCAYDYEAGGTILDDEIAEIFRLKRFGVRVTIISDSCFSGSVNRFVGRDRIRFVSPLTFLTGNDLQRARELAGERAVTTPRKAAGTVLFSGCSDTEYSYDAYINGKFNGAFTQAAIKVLKASVVPLSYARWHSATRALLPSAEYPQTPQLFASLWQRTWKL